jgi:hypothetical protein
VLGVEPINDFEAVKAGVGDPQQRDKTTGVAVVTLDRERQPLGLLAGRFDYAPSGILDDSHLRFFTLQTIRGLFAQASLWIEHVGHRYRRSWWREANRPKGAVPKSRCRRKPGSI